MAYGKWIHRPYAISHQPLAMSKDLPVIQPGRAAKTDVSPPTFAKIGIAGLGLVRGSVPVPADLFVNRPWLITQRSERLESFIRALGAEPKVLDADAHDRMLAYLSHLPQFTASALMSIVGDAVGEDGLGLAGRGLADTTRLAS